MQYTILLEKNENIKNIEAQEQRRFTKFVLEALEIPITWNLDEPLSVENKLKLRKILDRYNISVIDDMGGNIKIFVNQELIGEFYKCNYKLKQDLSKIDPNRRLYFEMTIKFWTVFEK